ncbi:MAG: formate--tetrahydrofolate ligase, partial [Candidatus Egerieousia sp.]|nr:formate--tetrahydrofolate ligase [Candidatus Egerieousia sp.]
LKMHGGIDESQIKSPNPDGIREGLKNLDRHIENLRSFGQTVVVTLNLFDFDTAEEIEIIRNHCAEMGVAFATNSAFADGGLGATELAQLVVEQIEKNPSQPLKFTYPNNAEIRAKIESVCRNIYRAKSVTFSKTALKQIERIEEFGMSDYPVCIAKTQYSFSADAKLYGSPENFNINIRDLVINSGSEMIVAIAGDIMRMPGLSKSPQAERIDVIAGQIEGLS